MGRGQCQSGTGPETRLLRLAALFLKLHIAHLNTQIYTHAESGIFHSMRTDIITAVLHFERGEQVFKHSEGSDLYPLSSFLNVLGLFPYSLSLSLSLWLCSKM